MPENQALKKIKGVLDHLNPTKFRNEWGGAFNGQTFRRKMFEEICDNSDFSLIVETGTYSGDTTRFMAKRGLPIRTVEFDTRLYAYAASRFIFNPSVTVYHNDSRLFLKHLSNDTRISKERIFFYLDAHWNDDLPLAEELEIIFSSWNNAIVMIDDFQVPDTIYRFDDFGDGKTLNLNYLSGVAGFQAFNIFFPAAGSTQETGYKRGSVVLCKDSAATNALRKCQTLREYAPE